jgi:uncharacterized protein YecE (DUF72 family)
MGAHCALRLFAWAWPQRPIRESIFASDAAAWRKSIMAWQRSNCDVYVHFDNDQKSAAPRDALALLRLPAR